MLDSSYHFCYNDYSKLENKNLQLVKNKGYLNELLSNITSKQRFPEIYGLLDNPKGLINTQIN